MGYKKLFNLLNTEDDKKIQSMICNLSSGYMDVPYLISETLKLLDDEHPYSGIITDNNKKALCYMLSGYFNNCWGEYIEDLNLDKLLKYGKIEVYKVDAANGYRYATEKEIASGVKGLTGENVYPAGEKEYKQLCLLNWTFTGKSYFFRQAGYELKYDNNGQVITSLYDMIQVSALDLKEMFTWVTSENYEKAIKKLKKCKGYKYASSEKDEIVEDIPIKQLIYNVYNTFPRKSNNENYRKALSLALKSVVNKKTLTPLEVSRLREIYDEFAMDRDRDKTSQNVDNECNESLKRECELLLKERNTGKVNKNHFAYVIIDTLKKSNYTKCSPKQYSIIEDALNQLNLNLEKEERQEKIDNDDTEIITDSEIDLSLANISDAIGDGLFDD